MKADLGKMFWGALALSVGFFMPTSRVVHEGSVTSVLCLAGVSTSLSILQNEVLGADAALLKLRRFFERRGQTGREEDSEAVLPDDPSEVYLNTNVRREYSNAIAAWSGVLPSAGNGGFVRHIREMSRLRNDCGEEAVTQVLRWRKPGPDRPHPLDAILPVGGEIKLYSRYNKRHHTLSLLARGGTKLPVCNAIYPILGGDVSLHIVSFPEDTLKKPRALQAAFHLVHQRVKPAVVGNSPAKYQKDLGVLAILDILTMPGKAVVVPGVHLPGRVLFNMFLVTTPVKGSLRELLDALEKSSSDDKRKRTARRAKLSVTAQMLMILHKLRDAGLLPPPVNIDSFVLDSTGKVLLSDFAPLVPENKRYAELPTGLVVPRNEVKRFTGGKRAADYLVHEKNVIRDLLLMIFEMWCRPGCSGGHSDTTSSAAASSVDDTGATGGDSDKRAAAAATPSLTLEDFDCEAVPRSVLKIVEMLLDPFSGDLGAIVKHHEFSNLMALARGETSDTQEDTT